MGVIVTIDVILVGAGYTFSATLLPHLENEDSTIHVTRNEEIWIGNYRQPKIHIYITPNTSTKHFYYF